MPPFPWRNECAAPVAMARFRRAGRGQIMAALANPRSTDVAGLNIDALEAFWPVRGRSKPAESASALNLTRQS
jgi:hypothetical protein